MVNKFFQIVFFLFILSLFVDNFAPMDIGQFALFFYYYYIKLLIISLKKTDIRSIFLPVYRILDPSLIMIDIRNLIFASTGEAYKASAATKETMSFETFSTWWGRNLSSCSSPIWLACGFTASLQRIATGQSPIAAIFSRYHHEPLFLWCSWHILWTRINILFRIWPNTDRKWKKVSAPHCVHVLCNNFFFSQKCIFITGCPTYCAKFLYCA